MADAPGWTKVEESAPGWTRIPDQFDRTKAELEARPAMGALDYAKELGKLAISPVTSIPGAVRQVLQFAQDPGSVAERNLNPRTADALPGAASSNPMADAFGNAVLAASTARGAPSIHEPELARLREAGPQEAPPAVATPAPAKSGMGAIDAIRLVQKLRKLTPGKLADAAIDATLSHIEELSKPKPPAPPAEALQATPQPVPKRGQPARPAAAAPAPPASAVTPEMARQASVPFTPEEQALADHVMADVEPQPPAAPPVGSDYVMPEPAQPQLAGRPNVGDPRLATPPVLPPPTFPRPEAPPATEPPAVNPGPTVNPSAPGSTPAVRPAEPSAALGAFGVDEPLVLNRARVKALAKDNGISEWDQLKMLRDQGIKIQDDPFMTGETQRNRRGKVTSPEPMKPEAKAAAGETKASEVEKLPTAAETEAAIHQQKMNELGELLNRKDEAPAPAAKPAKTPTVKARTAAAPQEMTVGEINKELDKLDAAGSKNTQDFIEAGRGNERPNDYLKLNDPLSSRARELFERRGDLRNEIERRMGPDAPSRLTKGFGPRKPTKAEIDNDPLGIR